MYYWSASKKSFFDSEIMASYQAAGTWPTDGVAVDDTTFETFGRGIPPAGYQRGSDASGMPAWVAIPPPSSADQWAAYLAKVKVSLEESSVTVERITEGVALGACSFTNPDVVAFMSWRKELRTTLSSPQPAIIPSDIPTRPPFPIGT